VALHFGAATLRIPSRQALAPPAAISTLLPRATARLPSPNASTTEFAAAMTAMFREHTSHVSRNG
jgi:hypothetical protein